MASKTNVKEKIILKMKKPSMYKVILFNDDYTTMEIVVEIIMAIFHKSSELATKIMLDVHRKGKGEVGVFTFDIAKTKMAQVELLAQERGYPLKAGMEEV